MLLVVLVLNSGLYRDLSVRMSGRMQGLQDPQDLEYPGGLEGLGGLGRPEDPEGLGGLGRPEDPEDPEDLGHPEGLEVQ